MCWETLDGVNDQKSDYKERNKNQEEYKQKKGRNKVVICHK